jgi:hypothetical protein
MIRRGLPRYFVEDETRYSRDNAPLQHKFREMMGRYLSQFSVMLTVYIESTPCGCSSQLDFPVISHSMSALHLRWLHRYDISTAAYRRNEGHLVMSVYSLPVFGILQIDGHCRVRTENS